MIKSIRIALKADLNAALERDPAATSAWFVKRTYPGYKAMIGHRYAHYFYNKGWKNFARMISQHTRKKTGIEIHPAAKIGNGFFIDHGTGTVIGETTEIGENCTIFQGVTLGGTGKDHGKRHPTLENNVMVSAGAKVLGPIKIGEYTKIGAGSVVLKAVPPHCTVVGVPGRIVRQRGEKVEPDMNQSLPDPILEEFKRLNERIFELEKKAGIHCNLCSIIEETTEKE